MAADNGDKLQNALVDPLERTAHMLMDVTLLASVAYTISAFTEAGVDAMLGPTIPFLGENIGCFKFTHGSGGKFCPEMAEALSLNRFGAVSSILFDQLFSRKPLAIDRHFTTAACLLLAGILCITIPLLTEAWAMQTSFFLLGLAKGVISLCTTSLLIPLHEGNQRKLNAWINVVHTSWGIGAVVSPSLVSIFEATVDYRYTFWVFGSVQLLMAFATVEIKYSISARNEYKEVREKEIAESAPEAQGRSGMSTPITIFTMLFGFFSCGLEFALPSFFTSYVEDTGMGSNTYGNMITSTFWLAFVFGRILAGSIEYAGASPLAILLTSTLLGCGANAYWTTHPKAHSALWLMASMTGALMAPAFPFVLLIIGETQKLKPVIVTFHYAMVFGGQMAIDIVVQEVIRYYRDPRGIPLTSLVSTALALVCITIVACLFKLQKWQRLQHERHVARTKEIFSSMAITVDRKQNNIWRSDRKAKFRSAPADVVWSPAQERERNQDQPPSSSA